MLIKCVDCGHSVSDRANVCPQCGGPMKTKPLTVGVKVELVLDIAMVCFGLLILSEPVPEGTGIIAFIGFLVSLTDLVWTTKIHRWWRSG